MGPGWFLFLHPAWGLRLDAVEHGGEPPPRRPSNGAPGPHKSPRKTATSRHEVVRLGDRDRHIPMPLSFPLSDRNRHGSPTPQHAPARLASKAPIAATGGSASIARGRGPWHKRHRRRRVCASHKISLAWQYEDVKLRRATRFCRIADVSSLNLAAPPGAAFFRCDGPAPGTKAAHLLL